MINTGSERGKKTLLPFYFNPVIFLCYALLEIALIYIVNVKKNTKEFTTIILENFNSKECIVGRL